MTKRIIGVNRFRKGRCFLTGIAEEVGRLIATREALLVCGGLGGVMEGAARGAKAAGAHHWDSAAGNKRNGKSVHDVPVATGFGEGRNVIIIRTSDALIAIGGEFGTSQS